MTAFDETQFEALRGHFRAETREPVFNELERMAATIDPVQAALVEVYRSRSIFDVSSKDLSRAEELLQEFARISPHKPIALCWWAECLEANGKLDWAFYVYRAASQHHSSKFEHLMLRRADEVAATRISQGGTLPENNLSHADFMVLDTLADLEKCGQRIFWRARWTQPIVEGRLSFAALSFENKGRWSTPALLFTHGHQVVVRCLSEASRRDRLSQAFGASELAQILIKFRETALQNDPENLHLVDVVLAVFDHLAAQEFSGVRWELVTNVYELSPPDPAVLHVIDVKSSGRVKVAVSGIPSGVRISLPAVAQGEEGLTRVVSRYSDLSAALGDLTRYLSAALEGVREFDNRPLGVPAVYRRLVAALDQAGLSMDVHRGLHTQGFPESAPTASMRTEHWSLIRLGEQAGATCVWFGSEPALVLDSDTKIEQVAERLVAETRRLLKTPKPASLHDRGYWRVRRLFAGLVEGEILEVDDVSADRDEVLHISFRRSDGSLRHFNDTMGASEAPFFADLTTWLEPCDPPKKVQVQD